MVNDLNTHDLVDIGLGFLSILGMLIGIIVSCIAVKISVEANQLSEKAVNLSKQAVEINLFTHKKDAEPDLQMMWNPSSLGTEIIFQLQNQGRGKATIYYIQSSERVLGTDKLKVLGAASRPIELLRNGSTRLLWETGLPEQPDTNEMGRRLNIEPKLVNFWIVVFYKDIIDTPYKVIFNYGGLNGNKLIPTLQELNPKHTEMRFFNLKF